MEATVDRRAIEDAATLLRSMGAVDVFLFGSAATGNLRSDSDIDLAVTGLPPTHYYFAASKAAEILGRPVDLLDLDDPTPITRYIAESGELVRVG